MKNPFLVWAAYAALVVAALGSVGGRSPSGTAREVRTTEERREESERIRNASALGTIAEFLGAERPGSDDTFLDADKLRGLAVRRGYTPRSVVAIVPDPVRAHNAATFDLAMVGIQKAAGYAEFQLDRHWFPWAPPAAASADAKEEETAKRAEEVSEAGVVLFRKPPSRRPWEKKPQGNGELLVVFLVGESPIIGVSARQLGHALSAAAGLADPNNRVIALLGPYSSGAAVSISRYVPGWWQETRGKLTGEWLLRFVSGTATGGAVSDLLGKRLEEGVSALCGDPVRGGATLKSRFRATVLPDAVAGAMFLSFAERSLGWRPKEEAAVLFEMDSAYGRGFANLKKVRMVLPLPSQVAAVRNEWDKASGLGDRTPSPGPAATRTFLNLNLGDLAQPADVIPETAALTTTVNDFAIGASLEQLRRSGIRQVGVFLTDVRDKLYLIRLLRQRIPGLVIFTSEAHMLLAHPAAGGYLDGLITYSSYPLRPETQSSASEMRVSFSSASEQGIFNAFCTLLCEAEGFAHSRRNPIDYYDDAASPGKYAPALWISVVSRGRFTPVAVLRTRIGPASGTSGAKGVDWIAVAKMQGRQINTAASWGYGGSWIFVTFLAFLALGPGLFLHLLRRQVQLDQQLKKPRVGGRKSRFFSALGLGLASGVASGATLGLLASGGLSAEGAPTWLPWAFLVALLAGCATLLASAVVSVQRSGEIHKGYRVAFSLDGCGMIALASGLFLGARVSYGADPDGLRSLRYLSGLPERSPVPGLVFFLVAAVGFGLCQLARETVKVAFLGLSPKGGSPNATTVASSTFQKALSALKDLDCALRNSWSRRGRVVQVFALAGTVLALVAALGGRLFLDVAIGRREVVFVFLAALAGLGAAMGVVFVRFQSTWRSVERFCRRVETTPDEWAALERVTAEELQRCPAKGRGSRSEPDWSPLRAFSVIRPPSQRTVVRTAAALRELVAARHDWPRDLHEELEKAVEKLDAEVANLAEHSRGPWLGRTSVCASARANDEAAKVLVSLAKADLLPEKARDLLAVREIAHISAAFRLMRNDVLFLLTVICLSFVGIVLFPFEPKVLTLHFFGLLATVVTVPVLATFASMNRNALLSLLSGSNAGDSEIFSLEYVKKAAAFLAVPALSFLATAFPEVWQPLGNVLWPLIAGGGK